MFGRNFLLLHTPQAQTINEVNYIYKLITSATLAHGSSTLFLKV